MGITTGGTSVCSTAAKKCEVKLERLSSTQPTTPSNMMNNNSTTDSSKFKRPLSSIKDQLHDDDLRPPVKLKVRIGGPTQQPQPAAQVTSRTNTARGVSPMTPMAPAAPLTLKKELPEYQPLPTPATFDSSLKSKDLFEAIDKLGYDPAGKISTSLLVRPEAPSTIPDPPKRPSVALNNEELLPLTPCVYVNDSREAFSPQLLDLCLKRPIVLVRNLAAACDMDLGLYTTKKLVEMHPNHPVEIRSQMEQTSDENWSPNMEAPVWYCTSSRSHTTIAKYAEYQADTLREYIEKTVGVYRSARCNMTEK